jgi:hypothetical protein
LLFEASDATGKKDEGKMFSAPVSQVPFGGKAIS